MNESASLAEPTPAPNADPDELRKFGELAHRWWDPTGEFAPLHAINPLRLDWIAARAPLGGARVVDVGCGGGILAESMAARGADVTGIDLSEKPLSVAELHGLESGIRVRYERIAAEDLAAREPRVVRRRDVHGDAGARARPRGRGPRLRDARQAGRPRVLLDDQSQREGLPVRGDRRRIRAAAAAAAHARLSPLHHAVRTGRATRAAPDSTRST